MARKGQVPDPEFIAWAKTRMKEMKQAAEDVTKALGLPQEAKYSALHAMFGGENQSQAIPERADAENKDRLKNNIYQLTDDFVRSYMKGEIKRFQALWKLLQPLPLGTMENSLKSFDTAYVGLSFAERSQPLLSVVSVILWATTYWSTQERSLDATTAVDMIVQEAQSRGCPRPLSYRLASYLKSHLLGL